MITGCCVTALNSISFGVNHEKVDLMNTSYAILDLSELAYAVRMLIPDVLLTIIDKMEFWLLIHVFIILSIYCLYVSCIQL